MTQKMRSQDIQFLNYKEFQKLSVNKKRYYIQDLTRLLLRLEKILGPKEYSFHDYLLPWSIAFADQQYYCIGGGVPILSNGKCGVQSYAGYSCPSGLEICNPILFGVDSKNQPVCHQSASTIWCFKNTVLGKNQFLQPVFDQLNKNQWDPFVRDLKDLCGNPDRVQEDYSSVKSACQRVYTQMLTNQNRGLLTDQFHYNFEDSDTEGDFLGLCKDCSYTSSIDNISGLVAQFTEEHPIPVISESKHQLQYEHQGKKFGLNYDLVEIDSCNTVTTLNIVSEYGCSTKNQINPQLKEFLERHSKRCTTESMRKAGFENTNLKRIELMHIGAHHVRRINSPKCKGQTCSWSNHSIGMSLDISEIKVHLVNGQTMQLPVSATGRNGRIKPGFQYCGNSCEEGKKWRRLTPSARFEENFNQCMNKSIANEKDNLPHRCGGGVLTSDYNTLHYDHLHLTAPVCPKNTAFATI